MPRITGPSIAEHVAQQEAAVVRAATELFAERGFAAVTMADIAERVGLARNSLYRYFPDKDHILLAWLRRETDGLIERSEVVARSDEDAMTRLRRWLRLQLEYVCEPDHQLFTKIASTLGTLEPSVMAAVVEQHQRLYATVEPIVAAVLADAERHKRSVGRGGRSRGARRDSALVTGFVVGLLRAASEALERGVPLPTVARELEIAVDALIAAGS